VNKLWVRLTLAFGAVTLTGLVIAAVLANGQVSSQFRRFVFNDQLMSSARLATLAEYYAQNGSWQGVERVLGDMPGPGGMGGGQGMGMRRGAPTLILADASGQVVYSRGGQQTTPAQLTRQEQAQATPITLNGQTVGYLSIIAPAQGDLTPAAQAFLTQINRALLQAGLIAGSIGLFLGLLIARGLTAPLGRLAAAARRISQGQLGQQVPVKGSDEMADLARAFNDMAATLQQAEILRRNMVADIAHELRTPLTVIQGNLQAILDEVYPLEKQEIARIYDETLMLGRLIRDLRELAQAEAGQLGLNIQSIALADVVNRAAAAFEGQAQEQGLTLEVGLPSGLPPVLADPDRVRQAIHNLLGNALRHTPPGGRITVKAEQPAGSPTTRKNGFIRISVIDTGPGISPQDLPHVFDRFWRADKSRSRDYGGSGLGLAITKQLIEAQGGQVGVESTGISGQGSRFWFTLPVGESALQI
jgi:two-component system OmpR family sensor kinase